MIHVTERGIRDEYHVQYEASLAVQPWRDLAQVIDTQDANGEKTVRVIGLRGMEKRNGMPNFTATVPTRPYTWYTEEYSDGFTVTRDEWQFDKAQTVETRIKDLAVLAAADPYERVEAVCASIMNDLGSGTVTDPFNTSIGFISTGHVINQAGSATTTESNYFTSSEVSQLAVADVTAPTSDEWVDILLNLAKEFQLLKGDNDKRMHAHITSFTVMVPPSLIVGLDIALAKNDLGTSGQNPLVNSKFTFKSMMLPTTTSTTGILMVASGASPLGLQFLQRPDRKALEILGPDSEHYKKEKHAAIWIEGRYRATHLFWENIIGATIVASGS